MRDSLVGKSSGVPEPESILWAGRKVSLGVQAPCEHVGAFRARLYAVLGTRAAANSRAGLRMLAIWEVALGGVCGACTKEGAGQWAVCCFFRGSRFSSKHTFFSARGGVTLSL